MISIAMALLLSLAGAQSRGVDSLCASAPFDMPAVTAPVIPSREVNLVDFGGIGDGLTDNTSAFASAIGHLKHLGGGRLTVSDGVWVTGPIELEDNIELHLRDNCMILFSEEKDKYPIVETVFEGVRTYRCKAQLSAVGKKNVAVTGQGIIDGSGDIWRIGRKREMPPEVWEKCIATGGILSGDGQLWYPSESYLRGARDAVQNIVPWARTMEDFSSIRDFLRPVMVNFLECEGVMLEGVTFQNSPCWNVHLSLCSNLIVSGISVRCPWYAKNGDGIDIESCRGMVLKDSCFDVGDDAICIKSGKDEEGRRRAVPVSGIIVDNCTVFHGHGGFVVGSEMSGGANDIQVSNCRFAGTDVGLRFKSKRGRGGVVENIYVNNIMMSDIISDALLFDLFYGKRPESGAAGEDVDLEPVVADESTPQFRDIFISDVVCSRAGRAMLFNGLPEMNVENVKVSRMRVLAEEGAVINETSGVLLDDVTVFRSEGPALRLNNVRDAEVRNFLAGGTDGIALMVTGSRNGRITLSSPRIMDSDVHVSSRAEGSVSRE